jgi:hypothetical protein
MSQARLQPSDYRSRPQVPETRSNALDSLIPALLVHISNADPVLEVRSGEVGGWPGGSLLWTSTEPVDEGSVIPAACRVFTICLLNRYTPSCPKSQKNTSRPD